MVSSPSTFSFPPPTTNATTERSPFRNDVVEGQDENNFRLQNHPPLNNWATTALTTTRVTARKSFDASAGVVTQGNNKSAASGTSFDLKNNIGNAAAVAGWSTELDIVQAQFANFRPTSSFDSPSASSPASRTNMREPLSVSNVVEHKHALKIRGSETNAHIGPESRETEPGSQISEQVDRPTFDLESAMTQYGRRGRNSTALLGQDSQKPTISATPPRHDGGDNVKQVIDRPVARSSSPIVIPRNPKDTSSAAASPKFRMRQHATQQTPQPLSRDSQSVHSQASSSGVPLPPSSADWQWGKRIDPDDQEQALFEQRLCEDVYGVAVRKINQNGKSNLRYVKCCLVDVSELEGDTTGGSSNRSISSRSRGPLSRLRGDRDRSVDRSEPGDYDAHRNLIRKRKKVLTWGKKKDVKIPLDRFVCVRKGKTNDRTRRNTSPSPRILSLITDDPQHPSLDIEAPTKLDRDKFARAFARFLDIPLENDDIQSVRSAEVVPMSSRDEGQYSANKDLQRDRLSAACSEPDMDAAVQRNNSHFKTSRPQKKIPLPVVTTPSTLEANRGPHIQFGRTKARSSATSESKQQVKAVSSSSLAQMAKEAAALDTNSLNVPDPQISSLPSSTRSPTSEHRSTRKKKSKGQDVRSTSSAQMDDSVVSSLSGAGFDQEIVEELHQALNDLRAELEESRAEAARAVKVAEQAIQSAENSNSKDWNSTVTHKAAEAAALAQKRSAEAMAKQRLAEERLDGERRNTAFWRKQAESAEEDAGALQTRAAAAAVQREAMSEALESERRNNALLLSSLNRRFESSEAQQRQALAQSLEQNQLLQIELESVRRQLADKTAQAKALGDSLAESTSDSNRGTPRKKLSLISRIKKFESKDSASMQLLSENSVLSSSNSFDLQSRPSGDSAVSARDLLRLHNDFTATRKQFLLMQKATAEELRSLPADAQLWAQQASLAVRTSQDEIQRLRSKLAIESATRRKLLHEVQDLRGAVRVYCRPRAADAVSTLSIASNEVLLLHRDRASFGQESSTQSFPLSFEFDGIFRDEMGQQEVYDELEEVCLGVLDGFNVCIMAYGQGGTGKTHSLLGDVAYTAHANGNVDVTVSNHGLHLLAAKQLFSVVTHRRERYQDVVTITIVEVHDERLCDMIAGTEIGASRGRVVVDDGRPLSRKTKRPDPSQDSGKPTKLEIKTDHNGATVVHGLLSVEVSSIEEIYTLWKDCLGKRAERLAGQGVNRTEHEAASHLIVTLKIVSTNISTGIVSTGKMQFFDLASSDVSPRRALDGGKKVTTPEAMMAGVGNDNEWKFINKSMSTLSEVVNARSQFVRSVPYRNSTLTHLLSDSLEADTKVIMVACVSPDIKDLQATACTLRFAAKMRKIIVGKATKHTLSHA